MLVSLLSAMPAIMTGCSDTTTAAVKPEPDVTTLSFSVTGMHCQGCVSTVRSAIAEIDGVTSCNVSLEDESATVQVTDAEVAQKIVDTVAELEYGIEQQGS